MQEEVESRTTNLMISVTKLTARALYTAYVKHRQKAQSRKQAARDAPPSGKQTVKQLIRQNQGVSSMEVSNSDLKGFERIARKYGVDYAIRKDASVDPPKYLVFFKAKDADALTAAFNEYSAKALNREKRPSVLKQLRTIAAKIAELPGKVVNRDKKRELDR